MANYSFKHAFTIMDTQHVINACSALVKAGKTPSIALVKTKLPHKVPLAIIVKGITQYQANPNLATQTSEKPEATLAPSSEAQAVTVPCSCAHQVLQLEQQVAMLTRELTNLRTQVQGLIG